jgi:hypothetical protein
MRKTSKPLGDQESPSGAKTWPAAKMQKRYQLNSCLRRRSVRYRHI